MAGSTLGTHFKITTWGESHGAGIGVVVDGCPAGLPLTEEDIQIFLNRRKPGQSRYSTPRREEDAVTILSGVFEGKTTGTPISMAVYNKNQQSKDYSEIASYYRPGHADYTFDAKYGFRDYRGGGRSSGRETIGRVAAGAVACKLLAQLGVSFLTYSRAIGPVALDASAEDLLSRDRGELMELIGSNPLYLPDAEKAQEAQAYLDRCMKEQNSAGGIIECVITGVPAGIGEPVFDKLDARLAQAIFSIGAVKGFEIGDGFRAAAATGLANNDGFAYCSTDAPADGSAAVSGGTADNGYPLPHPVCKLSNHAGGILGGISDGSPIIFRAAIKPTPSISAAQQTIDKNGNNISVNVKGRHDPIIVPRAVVVVESMAALTLIDLMLENSGSTLEKLERIYPHEQRS